MDLQSLRKGELGRFTDALKALQKKKRALLKEQVDLTEKMHTLYSGFVDENRKVCKSLDAAIVVSQRPGVIHYVTEQADAQQKRMEENRVMLDDTARIEERIRGVDAEIASLEAKNREQFKQVQPVSSFEDWFARNGRPQKLDSPQYKYVTDFQQSRKFVPHHGVDAKTGTFSRELLATQSAPRSQVVKMVRGRLATTATLILNK